MDVNFDKSTVNQRLIAMSSINFLNSSFYSLKYYVKDEFIDRMINYIQLACMLRSYKTCNSTVRFPKYEFYNKLLGGVTFFRVAPCVIQTQLMVCWFM